MISYLRLWWIILAVKIALGVWLPFANDEAYYWVWGHHPRSSYFDHPPMVGWLFWIGTFFENFGNAARVPGVILGHLTVLVWGEIVRPFLDEKKRTMWLAFVSLSPFFGVGSLVMTPDLPMMFFWALSLLLLLKLVEKPTAALYLAFGASLGLGFCSKYPIVLFPLIAIGWLLYTKQWRRIRWSYVPLTVLAGLLFSAPVLLWNARNGWASFEFQLEHGLSSEKRSWVWPFEYVGAQAALLFPTVIWFALRGRGQFRSNFLSFFGWIPILFFLYSSLHARVEANWPIMAHPAILSLAFISAPEGRWWKWTAGVWAIATLIVFSQVAFPWVPIDSRKLKTSEYTRFDVFLPEITADREMYFGSYQMASALSYELRAQGRQFHKLAGLNRRDFYDFDPHSTPKGATFWLGAEMYQTLPEALAKEGYEIVSSKPLNDEFKLLEVKKRAQDDHR
ncbi:MAG: glycosyltransferase family 39 protein [Bdellovibrionota bacterium]